MPDIPLHPGKTECITTGYQVIMQTKLSTASIVRLTKSKSQVGTALIHCDTHMSRGQRTFIQIGGITSMSPIFAVIPSFTQLAPMAFWGDQRGKPGVSFWMGHFDM